MAMRGSCRGLQPDGVSHGCIICLTRDTRRTRRERGCCSSP
jgi:hypothetical protein